MPCNQYVFIDRMLDDERFNEGIRKPVIASLRHNGCSGDVVVVDAQLDYSTHELKLCLRCDDEKCFPEKNAIRTLETPL